MYETTHENFQKDISGSFNERKLASQLPCSWTFQGSLLDVLALHFVIKGHKASSSMSLTSFLFPDLHRKNSPTGLKRLTSVSNQDPRSGKFYFSMQNLVFLWFLFFLFLKYSRNLLKPACSVQEVAWLCLQWGLRLFQPFNLKLRMKLNWKVIEFSQSFHKRTAMCWCLISLFFMFFLSFLNV